ncbi:hypothetical protein D3C83_07480 [compost metagenome]
MQFAVADVNESGDVAAQIEQRVQLHRRLGRHERRPRKYRKTQIDRRRIQGVYRLAQIDTEGLLCVKAPRHADQTLGEVCVDAPVARLVGIGQRAARHALAANAHVIELHRMRSKASFDLAQALAKRELRKRHAQELIEATERPDPHLAAISSNATPERAQRQMLGHLRKNQLAFVHLRSPQRADAQGRKADGRSSNRDQAKSSFIYGISGAYEALRLL